MKIEHAFNVTYWVRHFIDDYRATSVPGKEGWIGRYGDLKIAQQRAEEHAGRSLEWAFKQGDHFRTAWEAAFPVPNNDGGTDTAIYNIQLVDKVVFEHDELEVNL